MRDHHGRSMGQEASNLMKGWLLKAAVTGVEMLVYIQGHEKMGIKSCVANQVTSILLLVYDTITWLILLHVHFHICVNHQELYLQLTNFLIIIFMSISTFIKLQNNEYSNIRDWSLSSFYQVPHLLCLTISPCSFFCLDVLLHFPTVSVGHSRHLVLRNVYLMTAFVSPYNHLLTCHHLRVVHTGLLASIRLNKSMT